MSENRHTYSQPQDLITDPDGLARREAENGIKQFNLALSIIRDHVKDQERPFRLRTTHILQLHNAALEGIHPLAGTFRNTPASIRGSAHEPVSHFLVADQVQEMCDYVNDHWMDKNSLHLASYILWRLNWIHPFADGNGRTSRAISYVVLSIHLDSLLPGSPTIPDQIAGNKDPYYDALEKADEAWKNGVVDVSALEALLEPMLALQLVKAAEQATRQQSQK